jgi:hypothetical protein
MIVDRESKLSYVSLALSMEVTHFRPQRPGPEAAIQNAVAERIPDLFQAPDKQLWTGSSLLIGAGRPDLVIVSVEPEVFALAQKELSTPEVLAYLRAVRRAKLTTITDRIRQPRETIIRCLDGLVQVEAVSNRSNTFYLSPTWRDILPEIIAVEAKVANWRKAVEQAARNRIFAHKSFVALPETVAQRIKSQPIFSMLGLGLLAVDESHHVRVLKRPRRYQPRVWTYYYELAFLIASRDMRLTDAVCSVNGSGSG